VRKKANSGTKSKASKTGPKTLSNSSRSNRVFTTDKNSEDNSKSINVSAKKCDAAASVARELMDERNGLNITATPIAVNNSTATNDRRMQTFEMEIFQAQQLQGHQQQQSQLLFSDTATATTTASTTEDLIRRNILMKSIYDDEPLTRPKPIDYSSIRLSTNENNDGKGTSSSFNDNTFQSFMGQYWEDLPNGLSSSQVVDEIIATFQQQQQQQHY